jgi:predicted enzyme related to lactoylglutathione lyase
LGIVAGEQAHHRPQEQSAVLITLVVDEVEPWFKRLKGCGVKMLSEVKQVPGAGVECFFFEGPGGYHFEIQKFLNPDIQAIFRPGG